MKIWTKNNFFIIILSLTTVNAFSQTTVVGINNIIKITYPPSSINEIFYNEYFDHVWQGCRGDRDNFKNDQSIEISKDFISYYNGKVDRSSYPRNIYDQLSYEIQEEGKFQYLILKSEIPQKWLILAHNDIIFLYDDNDFPFFIGNSIFGGKWLHFAHIMPPGMEWENEYNSTSYLTEVIGGETIEYKPINFLYSKIPMPWVEGVEGFGIGEEIEIPIGPYNEDYKNRWISYISNGYVDYNRPDLYEKNSRIRELKITQKRTGIFDIITLEDTPNLQRLEIPSEMDGDNLTFEIVSVYKGSKYEDTCLNYILNIEIRDIDIFNRENDPGNIEVDFLDLPTEGRS